MSNGDNQRTPARLRRADAQRRTAEAWRLRTEVGLGWDAIAERVGYANGPNAVRAVRRWRNSLPALDVSRMRDEAIARGEWLIRKAAEDVEQDKPGAVTHMVRAEGRLASLIGLDAPKRTVATTYEETGHCGVRLAGGHRRQSATVGTGQRPAVDGIRRAHRKR